MIMNRYSILATGLAALLALSSCGSDEMANAEAPATPQTEGRISFRLGGSAARTRAADALTSKDYEANIQNVYVVAYKNNRLTRAVKAVDNAGSYSADVLASGILDIYFIANVEEGTGKLSERILALDEGSQSSELEALTADQAPGEYQATATDGFFPMTGKLPSAQINTQDAGGTDLDEVTVKRMAARIDIDNVLPSGFTINGVTINKRYDKSLIGRSGNEMTACGATSDDHAYSIDPATEMPYQGKIYLYEDFGGTEEAGASTEIVLHGTYNGHNVNPVVKFGTTKLVRNHIYNITLTKESLSEDLNDMVATITVKEWETGKTIAKTTTALTDRTATPAVAVTDGIAAADISDDGTGNLSANAAVGGLTFKVKVINPSSTTSKLVCTSPITGDGILITQDGDTTFNLDGKSEQVFSVTIDTNASGAARSFVIQAENLLNKDAASKTITITQAGS